MSRIALAAALAALAGGCGGDERLTVFAAASLTDVVGELAPGARLNAAGSDELVTQLREGAQADVLVSASPRYTDALHAEGLLERPRVFARNRLVLVVPAANPAGIESLDDLERETVKLVVAAADVPAGDYTRRALARIGRSGLLRRTVSEEQDVRAVLGKVRLGEADAGFVYATDAAAAAQAVRVVELPRAAAVRIEHAVGVVTASDRRDEARALVGRLLGPRGREVLHEAGFELP